MNPFSPNFTLGIIGGGQLGRMLALKARQMNIRTLVWTGGLEAPAAELANSVISGAFSDPAARHAFTAQASVATVEFENIPAETLNAIADTIPLHPSPHAIITAQHREREKSFLRQHNIPTTQFAVISNAHELAQTLPTFGKSILKTAAFGYDGKGQQTLEGTEDPTTVWNNFQTDRAILEAFVPFEKELSVMVARNQQGDVRCYDPAENQHRHHILDISIVPARIPQKSLQQAQQIATQIAQNLHYVGILGVEFFLLPNGNLLVNEIAPRPHNSGHHTLDACVTSQFEQQLRAVCGLPLGDTTLLAPVAMLNLLGDFWPSPTTPPNWQPLLQLPNTSLHLYSKSQAIGRRKMGHANILATTNEQAFRAAQTLKTQWLMDAAQ